MSSLQPSSTPSPFPPNTPVGNPQWLLLQTHLITADLIKCIFACMGKIYGLEGDSIIHKIMTATISESSGHKVDNIAKSIQTETVQNQLKQPEKLELAGETKVLKKTALAELLEFYVCSKLGTKEKAGQETKDPKDFLEIHYVSGNQSVKEDPVKKIEKNINMSSTKNSKSEEKPPESRLDQTDKPSYENSEIESDEKELFMKFLNNGLDKSETLIKTYFKGAFAKQNNDLPDIRDSKSKTSLENTSLSKESSFSKERMTPVTADKKDISKPGEKKEVGEVKQKPAVLEEFSLKPLTSKDVQENKDLNQDRSFINQKILDQNFVVKNLKIDPHFPVPYTAQDKIKVPSQKTLEKFKFKKVRRKEKYLGANDKKEEERDYPNIDDIS